MYGFFDGASRGNPGEAGAGCCLVDGGQVIWESARYLGRTTNNVAEYEALIDLLGEAARRGVRGLRVRGDSKLVVMQTTGQWKISKPHLAPLAAKAKALAAEVAESIEWVPREQNKIADALSNRAIDEAAR